MYCGRWADWPSPCWSALLVGFVGGQLQMLVDGALLVIVQAGVHGLRHGQGVDIGHIFQRDAAALGGSPQKAQLEIQTSSVVRPLVLALIYIVLFRAKVCDPVAALLPLLFAQVAIKVLEFFRNDKKGGDTAP